MGFSNAAGWRQAMDDGLVSEEAMLRWHFTANLFPPIPTEQLPMLIEHAQVALALARDEEWDAVLPMDGNQVVLVAQVIEWLHIEAFV